MLTDANTEHLAGIDADDLQPQVTALIQKGQQRAGGFVVVGPEQPKCLVFVTTHAGSFIARRGAQLRGDDIRHQIAVFGDLHHPAIDLCGQRFPSKSPHAPPPLRIRRAF